MSRESKAAQPQKERGRVGKTLAVVFGLAMAALVAAGLSVLLEWVGIAVGWWPNNHAQVLLATERSYIEAIENYPLMPLAPLYLADQASQRVSQGIEWLEWQYSSSVYAVAAVNTLKLVALRLVICLLTLPGFAVVALAALFEGLVSRDIRKYTGGHESSYVFHKAKRFVIPSLMATISLYLMMPVSIPPALVFGPALVLAGYAVFLMANFIKKFI